MSRRKKFALQILRWTPLLSVICLGISNLSAATNQFRGVNWADPGDNFQPGVIYVSGLSSTDTYNSAATVADAVISQFMSKLGTNSIRLPINEPTVSTYWGTYTGAIDAALSKGNRVILCYWSSSSGAKPADMNNFWNMWTTVVNKYGSNGNCFFEVYNEPNGYNKTDIGNLYDSWLQKFTSVPRSRVILDGTGYAQNVPDIASDSRFDSCLLAVHDYSFFVTPPDTTEAQWTAQFQSYVGSYASRTVCTEWGAPMSPGSKNGINYDAMDYNQPASNYFEAYVRALTSQLLAWKMGSFYWVGLKDGDWYSMTTKSGSGSSITLSVSNQSGLDRMQSSWADTIPTSVLPLDPQAARSSEFKVNLDASGLRMEFTALHSGSTFMRLFSLNGKCLKFMSLQAEAGRMYSRRFTIADVPEGFYLVKLENGGRTISQPWTAPTR